MLFRSWPFAAACFLESATAVVLQGGEPHAAPAAPGQSGGERAVPLSSGRGRVALATSGATAFHVRLLPDEFRDALESPFVDPDHKNANFTEVSGDRGRGIKAAFGSVLLSPKDSLMLLDEAGDVLAESLPLGDMRGVAFTTRGGKLYGHGAGPLDAGDMSATTSVGSITNRDTHVPYYYCSDGYAALGVTDSMVLDESQADPRSQLSVWYYTYEGGHIAWNATGVLELFLMPAATLESGTLAYYGLTGVPRVPPRHVFGFIASRWGWKGKEDVESVLQRFRGERFPLDSIILDFEFFTHENDYKYAAQGKDAYSDFGYNPKLFPSPRQQFDDYRSRLHVRVGAIRKPRLGNTKLLENARFYGWLEEVRAYSGRYLNFSDQAVRMWYGEQVTHYLDDGLDYWWNDEGEGDYMTYYWWNAAESDALRFRDPRRRFFSLNRAFTPGMPRLGAAVWTGDVLHSWEDLRRTPGMVLNWGLAGSPYVACDIGGFMTLSRAAQEPDLVARWYQLGTFMPIMRVHSAEWLKPHFPFADLWGEEQSAVMRTALERRYRLIPYHYSLAHAMFRGEKVWVRPMLMSFPHDPTAAQLTDQFMDGTLLVAPVLGKDSHRRVYLPDGEWYAFGDGGRPPFRGPASLDGPAPLQEVPVFAPAGAVVPLAPAVQHSDALPGGPLEVQVYAGADGSFELVEDDGATKDYESSAGVRTTTFKWDDEERRLSWSVAGDLTDVSHAFTHAFVTRFSSAGAERSPVHALRAQGAVEFG